MHLGYTHKNGGFYWHVGRFHRVNFLLVHRRNKSTDCIACLGVENVVIPAVERLLQREAGRTAVVVHWRFFLAFPVEVWVFTVELVNLLVHGHSFVCFCGEPYAAIYLYMQFCFYLWWTEVIDSLTMAVVHWSRKLWSEVWGILVVSSLKFYWTGSGFSSENNLGNFLYGKREKVDIC